MATAEKISMDCWDSFEGKLTTNLWTEILSKIPQGLYDIREYIEGSGEPYNKPTIFGTELVFAFEQFLKNIQFRIPRSQLEYLLDRFYEYVLYVIEYVLYLDYHNQGTQEKVFTLFQRSERTFRKAKNFAIQDLDILKEHQKTTTIALFTKTGLRNLALDLYFFTEALKLITEYQKLTPEPFLLKASKIEAKEHKSEPANLSREEFGKLVDGCMKVYREKPEKIRSYLEKKRK
jgi:hypothetical protein